VALVSVLLRVFAVLCRGFHRSFFANMSSSSSSGAISDLLSQFLGNKGDGDPHSSETASIVSTLLGDVSSAQNIVPETNAHNDSSSAAPAKAAGIPNRQHLLSPVSVLRPCCWNMQWNPVFLLCVAINVTNGWMRQ
jgi:hypothetical protein